MMNTDHIARSLRDARVAVPGIFVLVVLGGILWYYLASPLTGFVAVTTISEDGSARALRINLEDFSETAYTFNGNPAATALLAVPSPALDKIIFVTRARNEPRTLSITEADGSQAVTIHSGQVESPSWSPDGGSIAFAVRDEVTEGSGSPEDWRIFRAVRNGDLLPVGNGFRPYPSPHQRTFALTNEGISLLSYSDSEPSLVIASPVFVPETTPFAVSQSGTRVAWVAPADHSLQVFEDVNGYFVPVSLSTDIAPQSLVFSPNGRYLLGTTHTATSTTLHLVTASNGTTKVVAELPGYVILNAWRYEK